MSLFRFHVAPVKRQRRKIEKFRKKLAIKLVFLLSFQFVKNKQVRAEAKGVLFLCQPNLRSRNLIAVRRGQGKQGISFLVTLDIFRDSVLDKILSIFKLETDFFNAFGVIHHFPSKLQRTALWERQDMAPIFADFPLPRKAGLHIGA